MSMLATPIQQQQDLVQQDQQQFSQHSFRNNHHHHNNHHHNHNHNHHSHHHRDESNHIHSRSQSDPTKNNTSTPSSSSSFFHLKTPESEHAKLVTTSSPSSTTDIDEIHSMKKRNLDLISDAEDSTTGDANFLYNSFKRSRTAPPSPPYEIDDDLRLKSPMIIDYPQPSASLSMGPSTLPRLNRKRSFPSSKYLVTPQMSSDPIMETSVQASSPYSSPTEPTSPVVVMSPRRSMMLNTMDDYPDTCYKYYPTLSSNDNNSYNKEWKQRLEILVKADDPIVYSKFKDYCSEVSHVKSSSSSNQVNFNSRISSKIQKSTGLKLSNLIFSKYQRNNKMKISSIINFPFENNYTYQSTGYLQDIDTLRNQDMSTRLNHSINLSKYNHIFEKLSNHQDHHDSESLDDGKRKFQHYNNNNRRKSHHQQHQLNHPSMATGLITTDLPFNFKSSTISRQHQQQQQLVSPPPQPKLTLVTPPHQQQQHQQSAQMHIFVNSSKRQSTEYTPTISASTSSRIHPPTTPKQSLLPSPITSPSSKFNHHHNHHHVRTCISCKSVQSPCWRPSWSVAAGQLCNSCGLRYKKTGAHCLNDKCLRIPLKGEWTLMKNRGKLEFYDEETKHLKHCYKCLHCGGEVEVNE